MIFLLSIFYCFIISFVLAISFFFLFFMAKLFVSVFKAFLPNDNQTVLTVALIIVLVFLFVVALMVF